MDFSSKLTLMLVPSQDWLILHKDEGEIKGWCRVQGGLVKREVCTGGEEGETHGLTSHGCLWL